MLVDDAGDEVPPGSTVATVSGNAAVSVQSEDMSDAADDKDQTD